MASQRRVLITGLNGYIAAHTAATFLKAGYVVHGTVRARTPNVESLVRVLSQYHDGTRLKVFEVPDISRDCTFDKAAEGVHAIAHLASPVTMTEPDATPLLLGAVQGTVSLLGTALFEYERGALESVVLMSSISAIFSPTKPPGHVFTEADWNDHAEEEVCRLGTDTPGYVIYQASKTCAEKCHWEFAQRSGGEFGMTALCPAPVFGPPLYLPEPVSSLSMRVKDIYDIFHGGPIPEFSPIRSTFVDVRDVAELVLKVIEKHTHLDDVDDETRFPRYLLVGESSVSPQQVADILRAGFPERKDTIQEGNPGETYPEMTWKFDSSKARELLGRDWIGLEQSVLDTAKVFLDAETD